jgi:lysozyme family protein
LTRFNVSAPPIAPKSDIPAPVPGAPSRFDEELADVFVHEGGNDDDPRDPGGRTSRGILQREWDVWRQTRPTLPADVWDAPQNEVDAIYHAKYWDLLRCDELPAGVDYVVFDYGVNSGIARSAKVLQGFVGVTADGEIGPETIAATAKAGPIKLINQICDQRLAFYQGLKTWPTFGKGWSTRIREVRATAVTMAKAAPPKEVPVTEPATPTPVSPATPAPTPVQPAAPPTAPVVDQGARSAEGLLPAKPQNKRSF